MKKIDLGQSLEIFAHLGVLAGIIFLGIEISQNTSMMEAEMSQSRADTALSNAEAIFNSDYLPEIILATQNGEQLADVQRERFGHYFRGVNRNLENQLQQYQRGLLGDELLRSIRAAVLEVIAPSQVARDAWESTKYAYSDDYIELVDAVLNEE